MEKVMDFFQIDGNTHGTVTENIVTSKHRRKSMLQQTKIYVVSPNAQQGNQNGVYCSALSGGFKLD